jgi:HAD superfamily hydrolase (TIGR01549 family)
VSNIAWELTPNLSVNADAPRRRFVSATGRRLPAFVRDRKWQCVIVAGNALIKAVFFDYDGVLTTDKTGSLTTSRYLSQATGIPFSAIKAAFSRYNKDLTLGKTTHSQIWHEVCSALGQELSIALLCEAYESTPMNAAMFSLARRLKENYAVGIITDNKKDRIDHLKQHQNLESLFSPIVVSAEVGADKKSAKIFLHALHCAGMSAEESVFVDNNKDNLVAPAALGIKTIFHDDEKNDIEALLRNFKTLGVLAGNA